MTEANLVIVNVVVDCQDPSLLLAHLRKDDLFSMGEEPTTEEILEEGLVNPRKAPLDCGYEILTVGVQRDHGAENRYLMTLTADVTDPAALSAAARESWDAAWPGEAFEVSTTDEALYEVVLGSNASPAPLDLGFEIVDHWGQGELLPDAAPAP